MASAQAEARERRWLVRAGLVFVLAVILVWLAVEGGPPFIRHLSPGLAERTRYEEDGLRMFVDLIAWEGEDLGIIVCVEATDPERMPHWMYDCRRAFRIRYWDEQGKKLADVTDCPFFFPDHFNFAKGDRHTEPLVVRPPAEARTLVVYWQETWARTRSVPIPVKPGGLPRWVQKRLR